MVWISLVLQLNKAVLMLHTTICFLFIIALVRCQQNQSEQELQPYAEKVDSVLNLMTLEEKVGQMTLYTSGWDVTGPTLNENYKKDIKAGRCGNVFNAHTVKYNTELQRMAVEDSRLGIPLLFGYDVIHGHKTIFPIPLAESCSWDLELIEKSARLSAKEAAASGLNWTFNPMVDVARDPRWGRIAEGSGEDLYLTGLIGAAKVRGYQGTDLKDPFTIMACVKHFAAYGAAQAGRDYHTVDLSMRTLREVYLPPFKDAIDAGAATVMTSFNEINGIPASGNEWLLNDLLKQQWNFSGFVVTDYTSINEMVAHGFSRDLKESGLHAVKAGVDMDMQGGVFQDHLVQLVEEGTVEISTIDEAVRRILTKKYELGLFDDPYLYLDEQREKDIVLSDELMDHALKAAQESIVLLKNEPVNGKRLLPIDESPNNIALIGPLGDNQIDMLGSWHASGDVSKVATLKEALIEAFPGSNIQYVKGSETTVSKEDNISVAVALAKRSDLVILAVGENYTQNGEAASRSQLGLPGNQQALVEAVHQTGKPIIAVVMAGRPLALTWMDENIPAILNAWHLGTMSAQAITDVLSGEINPSGKLVSTFPRNVGQIPIFYAMKSTGRPYSEEKYTSKYLDVSNEPLYPFGYGLSYTDFAYSDFHLSNDQVKMGDELEVNVTVTNSGDLAGEEVVQLYLQDLFAQVTRPVKELKHFKKIYLEPGKSQVVSFTIDMKDLSYYYKDWTFGPELGEFKVFVGGNSRDVKTVSFELME